ncbi:MAG TPA: tungsten ABC transporter substrate-binding protein [Planctomycetes bacterium]|nr:tungsten ABC transporter substrate-binding protein [Planctomycetota bacterium]
MAWGRADLLKRAVVEQAKWTWLLLGVLAVIAGGGGCGKRAVGKGGGRIRLATTTSTENSGLLDVLLPPFSERYGISVEVIAVGTGRAMKHGENGDVDVILVHARRQEEEFIRQGFGVNRRDVMHNDFVIVGPEADPAGIRGMLDAADAMRKIAAAGATFVSRGDESGTHAKEKELWDGGGVEPSGKWYLSAGQGMGAVLAIAHEKQVYTLADRGTFIAYGPKVSLKVLVEKVPRLFNPYSVIAVNPERHPHVKYMQAMMFIGWLTSPEGRKIISGFKVGGEQLFFPGGVTGADR